MIYIGFIVIAKSTSKRRVKMTESQTSTGIFKIISYNTHLFHGSLAGDIVEALSIFKELISDNNEKLVYKDQERQHEILSRLSEEYPHFDVIALTEVWAHAKATEISENLPQGFESSRYADEGRTEGSCGLLLSARGSKIADDDFRRFEHLYDNDAKSAKGVMAARVVIRGKTVSLLQTHAQATYVGKEAPCEKARRRSLSETLFPMVEEYCRSDEPVFLMGDLNIVAGNEEYAWFNEEMNKRGLFDAWTALHGDAPGVTYDPTANSLVKTFDPRETQLQRLDYIYFRPEFSAVESMRIPTDWKTPDGTDCSDHYPVIAAFRI
jgi:exonuclease III